MGKHGISRSTLVDYRIVRGMVVDLFLVTLAVIVIGFL